MIDSVALVFGHAIGTTPRRVDAPRSGRRVEPVAAPVRLDMDELAARFGDDDGQVTSKRYGDKEPSFGQWQHPDGTDILYREGRLEKGKPCWSCGGAKPPGQGRKLCDTCRGPDLTRERKKETADRTRRDRHYWNRYRIRLVDYERMLEEQDGVCAICEGGCEPSSHFDVDHSAATGKVRGLLCRRCNLVVGLAELGILDAAVLYVRSRT